MHILMTGGTGLIGRYFIQHYPHYHYTVLSRDTHRAATRLPSGTRLIASLDELGHLNDFDAVINLAGEPIADKRWTASRQQALRDSRIQLSSVLVDLFAKSDSPPQVFLSGSAIGIYGDAGTDALGESSPLGEGDFASQLCRDWEAQANLASAYTRVVLLRTGVVLAEQGGALSKMVTPFRLGLGGPIGPGTQYMSWIHIQDQVSAMHHAMENTSLSGAVNVVSPNAETNEQFCRQLAQTLHRPCFMRVPSFTLKLLMGEASQLLLDSQNVEPTKLLEQGFTFTLPDLRGAFEDILN